MEQEEVVDSTETTQEVIEESHEQNDSARENEGAETTKDSVDREPETSEQRSARIKRQVEREARKSGISVEEYLGISRKEGSKESSKETNKEEVGGDVTERLDRSDLRYEGIRDKSEQDIVIEYARYRNMDVLDAMNTPAVKAELKEFRAKNATPSPTRRTGTGARDEVAYWADQMNKGNRPPTAEMRTKARKYLAENR
jgi:hypothetical protein